MFKSQESPSKLSLQQGSSLFIGAFLVAVALDSFLVPNQIMDGGTIGLAIILAYLTPICLGVWIVILNIPFLIIGHKYLGWLFTCCTLTAVLALGTYIHLLHFLPAVTNNVFIASMGGGLLIGLGVGLILHGYGSVDGFDILSIIIARNSKHSLGKTIMFFNIFIFGIGAFVFGWQKIFYSLLTYFFAYQTIDFMVKS